LPNRLLLRWKSVDLDLDLELYREEANTGEEKQQSTHGVDAMLNQEW